MFPLSLKIFRTVVNQGSLRLISKKNVNVNIDLKSKSETLNSRLNVDQKIKDLSVESYPRHTITKTIKILNEYPNPDSINWKEFRKKLDVNKNFGATVLHACTLIDNLEIALSYYDYIVKKGEKLTTTEIIILIKLFSGKQVISKHENTVKILYENIKEYMGSPVVQHYLVDIILKVPSCYYDFVNNFGAEFNLLPRKSKLAAKAFDLKNAELAYKIMDNFEIQTGEIFDSYTNYLCTMAKENKFSPDMITSFVEFCEKNNSVLNGSNVLLCIKNLFRTLKYHDKNYDWKLTSCEIDDSSVCSHCKKKLVDKCISESEFNTIKTAFLSEKGLTDEAVFINSTDVEVQRFLKFLKGSKPCDIVFDGLNILYSLKKKSFQNFEFVLRYFLEKGKRVLIISRVHASKVIFKLPSLKVKELRNKCQFFFTENMSNDDLFIIYAALYGGLGTNLLSGDFLQSHGFCLSKSLQNAYFKWKLYHHYIVFDTKLYPPMPSLGLSQLTDDENKKKLTWHISYFPDGIADNPLTRKTDLKWFCLEATKKQNPN